MTKFIKNDAPHKIIQFKEDYALHDPKQWSYLSNSEGTETVSCAFSQIDFKDKLQNQYYKKDLEDYTYELDFPTAIWTDDLNEEGIYVDPDGLRDEINEYEIGGGLHIYRKDGFEVTDFAKLCVMLSAITNICSHFKHSPALPGLDFYSVFEYEKSAERETVDEKPEITIGDFEWMGDILALWYFDFFDSPKLFEEKFNKSNSFVFPEVLISDFEITEDDSVIDSIYPREIYTVKCKIHLS